MNYLQPERLDRLAREYALGTLTGRARKRFERVLAQAPVAAAAVARWQERFTVLASGLPPMAPRAAVWRDIERRVVAAPTKARGWWRRLVSAPAFAGVLGGVLLCAVVLRQEPAWLGLEAAALPASYVGILSDAAGKPTVLASSRRHGRRLTLKMLQPLVVPVGQVAQLWALPKDGSAAFPIGVIPSGPAATLPLADDSEALFFNVARLAVSLEARPAAPGSAPSVPFVISGPCVKLW
jgi:anti-sigma-K factor RskA